MILFWLVFLFCLIVYCLCLCFVWFAVACCCYDILVGFDLWCLWLGYFGLFRLIGVQEL